MKIAVLLVLFLSSFVFGANQCVTCHKGIEDIRERDSGMMKAILEVAQKAGHEGNDCIVCHGGNPKTSKKKSAHKGTPKYFKTHKGPKDYYASPATPKVNANTCGTCHPNQVASQNNSLMRTQGANIKERLFSFGISEDYNHTVANYKTKNPDGNTTRLGSDSYKKYMQKLVSLEPQVFPEETTALQDAPTLQEIHKDPSLSVYTYLHQESSKQVHGDLGCASCHVPYSKTGHYEGADKSISKKKTGHMLTHQLQSSRKVKVSVNDINYSGVPVETCATCHDKGKSIALSYQGLMQSEHQGRNENHVEQTNYMHMKEDLHYKLGMLCQDCHTSNDLHGDGFLSGANAAAVEIECQDCHGTTKAYPWELPLGYSDEFNATREVGEPRGVTQTLSKYLKQGYVPQKEDGYVLSARGNPLPKAVKKGKEILIHLSSGKDITLKPLKLLKEEKALSKKALIAMDVIKSHTSEMECYTCHAAWAPQFYGNSIKIDYSKGKKNIDYLKASKELAGKSATTSELRKYLIPGHVTQSRSYIRWEEPALAQNGEGRVSPVIPGKQTSVTVIGKDGRPLLENHTYKIPNTEGSVKEKKSALTVSPLQPHTITKEVRSCESCHTSPKALGFGMGGGVLYDYSQFIDENGTELMSVGNHFRLSHALNGAQRDKLDRRGVCISCHLEIPEGNLAISAMHHISDMAELNINNSEHQSILNKILNISAWFQTLGVVFILLVFIYVMYTVFIKKKSINPRNRGWK